MEAGEGGGGGGLRRRVGGEMGRGKKREGRGSLRVKKGDIEGVEEGRESGRLGREEVVEVGGGRVEVCEDGGGGGGVYGGEEEVVGVGEGGGEGHVLVVVVVMLVVAADVPFVVQFQHGFEGAERC